MSVPWVRIGRHGISLVMGKLTEMGIDLLSVPHTWHFDLITQDGVRIEVKFANPTVAKRADRQSYERYAFHFHKEELSAPDFFVLVLNTPEGPFFYIVPREELQVSQVSFTPFSTNRKSKYLKYRDRWDLIVGKENTNAPILEIED